MDTAQPPPQYICPIESRLMRDPVLLIGDLRSYERAAIARWLRLAADEGRVPISPMSGQSLAPRAGCPTPTLLVANTELRQLVRGWCEVNPTAEDAAEVLAFVWRESEPAAQKTDCVTGTRSGRFRVNLESRSGEIQCFTEDLGILAEFDLTCDEALSIFNTELIPRLQNSIPEHGKQVHLEQLLESGEFVLLASAHLRADGAGQGGRALSEDSCFEILTWAPGGDAPSRDSWREYDQAQEELAKRLQGHASSGSGAMAKTELWGVTEHCRIKLYPQRHMQHLRALYHEPERGGTDAHYRIRRTLADSADVVRDECFDFQDCDSARGAFAEHASALSREEMYVLQPTAAAGQPWIGRATSKAC